MALLIAAHLAGAPINGATLWLIVATAALAVATELTYPAT